MHCHTQNAHQILHNHKVGVGCGCDTNSMPLLAYRCKVLGPSKLTPAQQKTKGAFQALPPLPPESSNQNLNTGPLKRRALTSKKCGPRPRLFGFSSKRPPSLNCQRGRPSSEVHSTSPGRLRFCSFGCRANNDHDDAAEDLDNLINATSCKFQSLRLRI